ncbi:MAG: hypothetical protein L0221_14415 [Chloroflexi bacterium]|nr:hypothetical protein [Chloroflexota bacterium]
MPTDAVVAKVDHVFVPVADPAPLFELFTGPLGLPVAWPIHDYGPFRSGGVCLGNANIEFVAGDPAVMSYFTPTEPLTVRGIGFEPASERTVEELDARKLRHTDPFRFEGHGHAHNGLLWTNVFLSGLAGRSAVAFTCEWHAEESVRGRAAVEAIAAGGGGPLGVRRLSEVTLGVVDMDRSIQRWTSFLSPAEPDPHGAFHLGDGPAIRLKPSPIEGVAGLWVEVASLAHAKDALMALDLLGPARASGVGLDYARTGGLDVWLAEPRVN